MGMKTKRSRVSRFAACKGGPVICVQPDGTWYDNVTAVNLDRIIEIIRTEDEPKPIMMAEFELTDRQAEAILNMRLRSLRKLEEMELRRERDALLAEKDELEKLLDSAEIPLPENAAVDHLEMQVGERRIEGQLRERTAGVEVGAKEVVAAQEAAAASTAAYEAEQAAAAK